MDKSFRFKKSSNKDMPSEVHENSLDGGLKERRLGNWIDRMVEEHRKQGGFDNLEGAGKPLKIDLNTPPESILHGILKNANVLPPWLELQHEIRDSIGTLLKTRKTLSDVQYDNQITTINTQIKQYNKMIPNPVLQKGIVNKDNLEEMFAKWS